MQEQPHMYKYQPFDSLQTQTSVQDKDLINKLPTLGKIS